MELVLYMLYSGGSNRLDFVLHHRTLGIFSDDFCRDVDDDRKRRDAQWNHDTGRVRPQPGSAQGARLVVFVASAVSPPHTFPLTLILVLQAGDTVGVVRKEDGSLHFFVNGVPQGPAAWNVPPSVYAVVDLYGQAAQATIMDDMGETWRSVK